MEADQASLQAIHDMLLATKPADVEHGPANCPVCAAAAEGPKEEDTLTTYTEEQARAMVDEAVGPLQAQLAELQRSQEAGEIDKKISESTAPLAARIADLESEKDVLTAKVTAVTAERDDLVAAGEAKEAAETAAAERAEVLADRVAKAGVYFTEEAAAERAERWADMDAAAFETLLDDLKTTASASARITPRPSPLRGHEQASTGAGTMSAGMREVLGLRRNGVSPQKI